MSIPEEDKYLDYIDGLAQRKIITLLDDNRFEISKVFLKEIQKKLKIAKQSYPNDNKWDVFNTAMSLVLQDKIVVNLAARELTSYTKAMMSLMACSGLYQNLFGDEWKNYMSS